jgi:hypothetical protein
MAYDSSSSWQLPSLRRLEVVDYHFPAAALLHMPQLQHISFHNDPAGCFDGILTAMQHLQQLQTLKLSWCQGAAEAAGFAGLTASSHLTSLELHACDIPAGLVHDMFWQGHMMPQLQLFRTTAYGTDWDGNTSEALCFFRDWTVFLHLAMQIA